MEFALEILVQLRIEWMQPRRWSIHNNGISGRSAPLPIPPPLPVAGIAGCGIPCGMPQPASSAAGIRCQSADAYGLDPPSPSVPTRVRTSSSWRVWFLVHWVPPGKAAEDPKLNLFFPWGYVLVLR